MPKLADAEKFEVNQMPQLYECGETVNDKQWLGVCATIQSDALTKLWVSGGRYPQVIATIASASDLFNFMVNFNPEAATQGFAAQSLISALSGLHNYNKSFDTQFALTVRGKKAVFVNCYYPTMDDKHRESACTPLSRDTDEISEIGWIQTSSAKRLNTSLAAAKSSSNCANQSPPDCTFSYTPTVLSHDRYSFRIPSFKI